MIVAYPPFGGCSINTNLQLFNQGREPTESKPMTNPLTTLRQYLNFSDTDAVNAINNAAEASGVYFDELQADGDPGVYLYRCGDDILQINCDKNRVLSLTTENSSMCGTIEELEDKLLSWAVDEGYEIPGFATEIPDGCPASITCKHDIDLFVDYLFDKASVAYHWDEMASSYVNAKQERVFSAQVSKHIDNLTEAALTLDAAYFQGICMDMQQKAMRIALERGCVS